MSNFEHVSILNDIAAPTLELICYKNIGYHGNYYF